MSIVSQSIFLGFTQGLPTYSLGTSSTSVNEGSTVTFTTTTANVSNGTTLYWSVSGVSSSDFTVNSTTGSFTIGSNGQGSVSLTLSSDSSTEGTEYFTFYVRTGSTSGTIVATSPQITINDTSSCLSQQNKLIKKYFGEF